MKNGLIILAFLLGGALLYSVYVSRNISKYSQSKTDSLLNVYEAQKLHISLDSIKYSKAIDSLSNQIKTIETNRKNELRRLKSQLTKINNLNHSVDFSNYNDSLERCCTMRHE
jgi:hypothetical protein